MVNFNYFISCFCYRSGSKYPVVQVLAHRYFYNNVGNRSVNTLGPADNTGFNRSILVNTGRLKCWWSDKVFVKQYNSPYVVPYCRQKSCHKIL